MADTSESRNPFPATTCSGRRRHSATFLHARWRAGGTSIYVKCSSAPEYGRLSEGGGDLVGALTSRAEVQMLRLSCLYAPLDGCRLIGVEHLRAALALWNYVTASVTCILSVPSFGVRRGRGDLPSWGGVEDPRRARSNGGLLGFLRRGTAAGRAPGAFPLSPEGGAAGSETRADRVVSPSARA